MDVLNESRSGDVQNIVKSSSHIYSHLMKIVMNKEVLKRWINTVIAQNEELLKITNKTYWAEAKTKMNSIKVKAINEYVADGNNNEYVAFNIVYNDFSNIELFKDKNKLKNYMIKSVKSKNISNKDELISYIESK